MDKYFAKRWRENSFPDVVMENYRTISLISSSTFRPGDYQRMRLHVDMFFELFRGMVPEELLELDLDLPYLKRGKGDATQIYCCRKIALISNFLYMVKAIPQVKYEQYYHLTVQKATDYDDFMLGKDSIRVTVAKSGRIPYDVIVNFHLKQVPRIIREEMDITLPFHIEILFSILAPYISIKRNDQWDELDMSNLPPLDLTLERYNICGRVMDDGNFVWERQGKSIERGTSASIKETREIEDGINIQEY